MRSAFLDAGNVGLAAFAGGRGEMFLASGKDIGLWRWAERSAGLWVFLASRCSSLGIQRARALVQVASERYDHRRSTCITTNRLFKDWTKVFPDLLNAQVIAERLTERAEVFVMDGKKYRDARYHETTTT